jgi:ABC-2 type transport system permease protein
MPIYRFCILVFPIIVVIYFTSLMHEGVPENMPIGVVDLDRTTFTRGVIRQLDAMQTSQVVSYYNSVSEARDAIQKNKIFAFIYFPEGCTADITASRQPTISVYYTETVLVAGSMTYRDLKTACSLAAAKVGTTKLAALGKSSEEIKAFLQPIALDLHLVNNPWLNYNIYLSTYAVPGVLMIFIFLLVPYSIWTEVKFNRSREWMQMAGGNVAVALIGKLLPHTLMFLAILLGFEFYIYGYLDFPHEGGIVPILVAGVLSVLACQGFGVFVSSFIPSLRMSMSICALWSVVSFSTCGATYPVTAMHPMIHGMSILFPLRHYIVIYQQCIFDGFPLSYVWINIGCLLLFTILPIFTGRLIKKSMTKPVYIP